MIIICVKTVARVAYVYSYTNQYPR